MQQPNSDPTASHYARPIATANRAGLWYFGLIVITAGTFSAVPFAHAAGRLRRPSLWRLTGAYSAVGVALISVVLLTGPSAPISVLMMAATMFVGCRQLRPLRREVYGLEQRLNTGPTGPAATDPAVFAALSARMRRQDVRKLAAQDPLLARDLRIGRPDLARKYDDGGLVDLNNAPANTIADVCELDPDEADKIVSRRQLNGGSFTNIDELLVLVNLPFATWDRVRDRGVLLTK